MFDKLTGLTQLFLSRNNLSSLPPGVFDNLTKLTRLDLNNNNLNCLPTIPASVTTLRLDNSRSSYSACGATLTVTAHASDSTQATLNIANHSGDWYYKANAAPYAACSAEVSSGTNSASLTNLAGNTSYIFTPYSDSSCSTKLGRATTAYLTKPGEPDVSVAAGAGSGKLTLSASVTGSGTLSMWQYRQKAISDSDYGGEENITATSTSLSHTVSGLTNGTSYQFQVRAVNAAGNGAWSAEATGTPLLTASPVEATTATLTASAVKGATATLTINGHTGDWSYQVSPRPPGTLSCTKVLDGRTAVTLTGLTPGTTYTSTVYSDRDCTQKIASQTFTTLNEPPTFPRGRTIDAQSYVQHTSVALTLPAATGGSPPLTYALAPGLPAGLTFDPGTRTLAGTPTALQGATRYTYTVTDQDGEQATLTFTITVRAAADKAIIENGLAAQGRALLSSATGVIGARFRNPGASSSDGVGACAGEAPRNEDRGDTDTPPPRTASRTA